MNTGLAPDGPLTAQVTNAALVGKAADWLAGGHRLALAFVMQTWGSSPRPAGSLMLAVMTARPLCMHQSRSAVFFCAVAVVYLSAPMS